MHQFTDFPERTQSASLKWQKYAGRDILPMWVADMDFPAAPEIQSALEKRLQHPIYGYTIADAQITDTVCDYLENDLQWKIDKDWIVWLPGVVPGLSASCRAFATPGQSAMTNSPIYHHFLHVAQDAHLDLIDVPLKADAQLNYEFDLDAMNSAVRDDTRMLLLCSPHNPVGRAFSAQELSDVADFATRNDMLIISDEIHCGLVLHGQHIATAVAAPNCLDRLVALYSPSKTFNLAGLNCSFAVIPNPTLRAQFQRQCRGAVSMVPPLAYSASLAAYRDAGQWRQDLLDLLRAHYQKIKAAVDTWPGVRLTPLQATYLAWLDVSQLGYDDPSAAFEAAGVGLSPGRDFADSRFLRLNFACPESQLDRALSRMSQAVFAAPNNT